MYSTLYILLLLLVNISINIASNSQILSCIHRVISVLRSHVVDYSSRGDSSEAGVNILILTHTTGLYPKVKVSSTNSYVTIPEPTGDGTHFLNALFQREEWIHISVVYDFHGKSLSVYTDGRLVETKRWSIPRAAHSTFHIQPGGFSTFCSVFKVLSVCLSPFRSLVTAYSSLALISWQALRHATKANEQGPNLQLFQVGSQRSSPGFSTKLFWLLFSD